MKRTTLALTNLQTTETLDHVDRVSGRFVIEDAGFAELARIW